MKSLYKLIELDPRYLRYLWPYTRHVIVALLMMIGIAALEVMLPWPLAYIIDNVIGGTPFTDPAGRALVALVGDDPRVLTAVLGGVIIMLTALNGLLSYTSDYVQNMIKARTTLNLRSDVFAHVQRLSLQFHDRSRTGEIINRVTNDTGRIMEVIISSSGIVVNVLRFVGIIGVMLVVNWRFCLIALAYAPLLVFLFNVFRRNIKTATKAARTEEGQIFSVTQESIGAIRVVQAFGREADEQHRFEQHGAAQMHAELCAARWEAGFTPVVELIKAAGTTAVVWYGVAQIVAGQLTLGQLTAFLAYLVSFYSPLTRLSRLAGAIQKAAVSGERVAELLDADEFIADAPQAKELKRATGLIQFEHVGFDYGDDRPVLRDISFTAQPGQMIGLVGHTGAGKTTIANLLMRFYDVQHGRILLDGIDVRQIGLRDLRQQFAIVPQEAILFATSIRDNIAYGRPQASMHAIVAAATAANADAFIRDLPHGYNTVIGERGVTLSGGQRQRIAIARAILRDPPILILDEPTAALDAAAERDVMTALERLMRGRTTIVIAHRLSTIRHADQILVLEHGYLAEHGRHNALVARNGRYAHLWRLQHGNGGAQSLALVG